MEVRLCSTKPFPREVMIATESHPHTETRYGPTWLYVPVHTDPDQPSDHRAGKLDGLPESYQSDGTDLLKTTNKKTTCQGGFFVFRPEVDPNG